MRHETDYRIIHTRPDRFVPQIWTKGWLRYYWRNCEYAPCYRLETAEGMLREAVAELKHRTIQYSYDVAALKGCLRSVGTPIVITEP
jgi:hypothetical protein